MTTVYINKRPIDVENGCTIYEAAAKAGIKIPTLCHVENQHPKGACRVCMVDVEGAKSMVASCTTPVTEGIGAEPAAIKFDEGFRSVEARRGIH